MVKFKLSGEVTPTKILLSLEDILFIDSGFTIYSPDLIYLNYSPDLFVFVFSFCFSLLAVSYIFWSSSSFFYNYFFSKFYFIFSSNIFGFKGGILLAKDIRLSADGFFGILV